MLQARQSIDFYKVMPCLVLPVSRCQVPYNSEIRDEWLTRLAFQWEGSMEGCVLCCPDETLTLEERSVLAAAFTVSAARSFGRKIA